MAKGMQALTKDVDLKLATIELMEAILTAQQSAVQAVEAQSQLQKRLAELEASLDAKNEWAADAARYKLTEFATGVMAYVLDPELAEGEPSHRLCATCFSSKRKSILQVTKRRDGGEIVECQVCNSTLCLSKFPARQISSTRKVW
jgi:hypothetical protein